MPKCDFNKVALQIIPDFLNVQLFMTHAKLFLRLYTKNLLLYFLRFNEGDWTIFYVIKLNIARLYSIVKMYKSI